MDVRARIAALTEAAPELADELALRGALIELVQHAEVGSVTVRLPGDLARARLARGIPLLDGLDVPIPSSSAHLFERLTVAMLAHPDNREPAEALLTAVRGHRLHADHLLGEAVVGHADHLAALAASVGLPASLIGSLADLASRPLLAEVARRLGPALALGRWEHGYCPICGARPMFAEQNGADVRLRCGRCATGWAWTLPRCPDCPAGRLTVLDAPSPSAPSERGPWTLLGCDACRAYLKLSAAPLSDRVADLLLDDLETWTLDRQALDQGLRRSSEPGYRLEHGEPGGEELDDD